MQPGARFQAKLLTRQKQPQDYAVYRAALEWDLSDPIVIDSADDLKSGARWQDRVTPYHHQVTNLITFCRRLPVTLLADDVGLGKTISAGLIVSELIARGRLSKILIVCPKVLCPQWQEELTTKFGIESVVASGRELVTADTDGAGAVITTYNSARLYLDDIPEDRFQMLVLDEAHKLRNLYGTDNPPQVAQKFQAALAARRFRFVLMLTATPIQNRLWDIYSLVDLLTVARGHQNPFGTANQFLRKFVEDGSEGARRLKEKVREEFRTIVYGYMSRVRRGDAHLTFPERKVQLHRIQPTQSELDLIKLIAGPVQSLNKLTQISILQALVSSPQALAAQLENMARKGSVPRDFAEKVRAHVETMPPSSKLAGLAKLIESLRAGNKDWRLVIFTTRRETQTAIQTWLESVGLVVGLINGESGQRNQETIRKFRAEPPECRVIVSTEAGAEGVNLQVANVLVNYDLPWNPMIVEQRIGRIQRLNSRFAHVNIFNMVLTGTFEEYIVGRLMEKLQMAAQAIGDIEALLQGADVEDGEADTFEDRILQLVLASLAGQDVSAATKAQQDSIELARQELAQQTAAINDMLGSQDGREFVGPRPPDLPETPHSMDARAFVPAAFITLGARVAQRDADHLTVTEQGIQEHIRLVADAVGEEKSTACLPGTPAFQRLVSRVIASGLHAVDDDDGDIAAACHAIAQSWAAGFDARLTGLETVSARRTFTGMATLRVRATVAHDSYERLVMAPSDGARATGPFTAQALSPLPRTIDDAAMVGLDATQLTQAAEQDAGIAEFMRFYLERRAQECGAAGDDERKRQKLYDDFTPRLEITLAGLEGHVRRVVRTRAGFSFGPGADYATDLDLSPATQSVIAAPAMDRDATGALVPGTCLERCAVSGERRLRHTLERSEESGRYARPDLMARCEATGKRALPDELAISAVTGRRVLKSLLRTSAISGKQAEAENFQTCAFTGSAGLKDEITISEISGKPYRADQTEHSRVSGKRGHRGEFVHSSVSGAAMLRAEAVVSAQGAYCLPEEARTCTWTERRIHPDDIRICALTGLPFQAALMTGEPPRLGVLAEMLDGTLRPAEGSQAWPQAAQHLAAQLGGTCRIDAAALSPTGKYLAVCCEVRTLLGLRVQWAGALVDATTGQASGRMTLGKRANGRWAAKSP